MNAARGRYDGWALTAGLAGGLVVWEWLVRSGTIPALFWPAPTSVARAFVKLVVTGRLAANVTATLLRVLAGCLLGGVPGLALGLLLGWSPRLRTLLDPVVAALHAVPKVTLLPLVMLLFGIGETSKVLVVALSAFFPLLVNTVAGVLEIHPLHFEVARNYGAGPRLILTRVILPGSLPLVLAGVRLAVNTALLISIAVELVAAQTGLGAQIWLAWQTLRVAELYASLMVTAAVGMFLNWGLQRLAARLAPWKRLG